MNTITDQATTDCKRCGETFDYEPIIFGGTDLGLSLATHCESCSRAMEAAKLEEERMERQAQRRAAVIGLLPPELLPVWLDPLGTDLQYPDFNRTKWEVVKKWRPGPHGNFLGLIGGAGTCKTRCLALMAEKIVMQGHRLVWTSAMKLYQHATVNLRSRDRGLMAEAREHLGDCMAASYLVIDDLGNNEWSPAFESQLFTILDHRKNYRLPILYSANSHPSAFHTCITSVNPDALIGRLVDRANLLDFSPELL